MKIENLTEKEFNYITVLVRDHMGMYGLTPEEHDNLLYKLMPEKENKKKEVE